MTGHESRPFKAVAGAGFVALDILLGKGDDNQPNRRAGGTCGNVLAILGFFGFEATPIARLGADEAARTVITDLQSVGVNCQHIQCDPAARTPRVIEFLPDRAGASHRFVFTCPMCQRRFPRRSEPNFEPARESIHCVNPSLFFFDRSGPVTVRLAREARELGAIVMFEPDSLSNTHRFYEALQISHIVKYASERAGRLIEPWLREMDRKPRLVIETLDGGGLRYMLNSREPLSYEWNLQKAFPVGTPVDQAGAGDWCSAGLISRIISKDGKERWRDRTVRRALAFGQALAAASILFPGPRGYMENYTQQAVLRAASSTLRQGKLPEWTSQPLGASGETVGVSDSIEVCSLCLTSDQTEIPTNP